jgi:hypothetical protein
MFQVCAWHLHMCLLLLGLCMTMFSLFLGYEDHLLFVLRFVHERVFVSVFWFVLDHVLLVLRFLHDHIIFIMRFVHNLVLFLLRFVHGHVFCVFRLVHDRVLSAIRFVHDQVLALGERVNILNFSQLEIDR